MEKFLYKGGIYKILFPSGRVYIGQSVNLNKRINLYRLGHFRHQPKLKNAFGKYKFENVKIEILVYTSDIDDLNWWEEHFISKYDSVKNGYNATYGGGNRQHTPEILEKIRKANTGKKHTDETKKKISDANTGRAQSDELKLKQSMLQRAQRIKAKINTNNSVGITQTNSGRWQARIGILRNAINIGTYDTKEDAQKAYFAKVKELSGEILSQEEIDLITNYKKVKTSKYTYVYIENKKGKTNWIVSIKGNYIGSFSDEDYAGKVASAKLKQMNGETLSEDEDIILNEVENRFSSQNHKRIISHDNNKNKWIVRFDRKIVSEFDTEEDAIVEAYKLLQKE